MCMCVCVHACACACVCVCICVCMHVCLCVCVCVCVVCLVSLVLILPHPGQFKKFGVQRERMPFTGNFLFLITDGWKDMVTYNEAVKFVYTLLYLCVLCDSLVSTCGAGMLCSSKFHGLQDIDNLLEAQIFHS